MFPPVSVYLILLFYLIDVSLSLLLHFYFAVWRIRCSDPCLPFGVVLRCLNCCLSCVTCWVGCFPFPKRNICGLPLCVLLLFVNYFFVFSSESLPSDDVLCRPLSRPLPSAYPVCLICFVFSDGVHSRLVLVWLRLSCDYRLDS